MTASTFERALKLVLKSEGGWVDNPADPGGATNLGVTIGTLSSVYGRPATKAEVKALTPATVAPIYRKLYWGVVHGDDLPSGVDYAAFDFAVNSGPKRAAMALQRVVGVADDGRIGDVTLAAVRTISASAVIDGLMTDRLAFLRKLSTWKTFGKGWSRRCEEVHQDALAMVVATGALPLPVPGHPIPPMPVNGGAPTTIVLPGATVSVTPGPTVQTGRFGAWLKSILGRA